ncbi:hypothetical protein [Candidatus Nitrospira bockiana]
MLLEEDRQDGRLESGERLRLNAEIRNIGVSRAEDVMLQVSGTPAFVHDLPSTIRIGNVEPNETKRVTVSGAVSSMVESGPVEIVIMVTTAGGAVPEQKKFVIEWAGSNRSTEEVDRPPDRGNLGGPRRAIGVAVGIGAYRDARLPSYRYAGHDAQVVADYLDRLLGVPQEKLRLLIDDHALIDDLVEVFEEWLPHQAEVEGEVFVFISGMMQVDETTAEVLLLPYDTGPRSLRRRYPIRRIRHAIANLPVRRAVLLLDLRPLPTGADATKSLVPVWDSGGRFSGGKMVQIQATTGTQEAISYDDANHGLFTYFLLKGLGGAADHDRDRVVAIGELCDYVRENVRRAAQERWQRLQEPVCLSAPTVLTQPLVYVSEGRPTR